MSALIRQGGAAGRVQPFVEAQRRAAAQPMVSELPATHPLEARVAELEAELEALRAAHEREIEAASRYARTQALNEVGSKEEARLEVLRSAIGKAIDRCRSACGEMERLPPLVAAAALARVFGDEEQSGERVERALRHWLDSTHDALAIRIRVSPEDFSEESTARLASETGVEVERDPRLDSGACELDLGSGFVEIGADQQWQRLRALLIEEAGV